MFMIKKQIIVTTSWDDGYSMDIRIAELLDKYGLKGTFYVPVRNHERKVMDDSILTEIARKYEIGGHTVNHIFLNTLRVAEAAYEISNCKTMLEDKLGKQIEAFCYPGGKFSDRDIKLVEDTGFLFGRSTKLLRTTLKPGQKVMNTSVQAFNHSGFVLTKHCLKNMYPAPVFSNLFFYREHKNFPALVEIYLKKLVETGGVFHLWGHSWEIDKFNLWSELETVFEKLSLTEKAVFLSNSECWKITNNNGKCNL